MELTNNITDTALIFEGGGMRGVFSAAIVNALIEAGVFFDYVAGISAGSSNTVNYLARAPLRARKCFVEVAADPNLGSWWTWLRGKGRFNAEYIYEQTWVEDGPLPFDFDAFMANPARFRIGAFDAVAGQTVYWSRDDLSTAADLMRRVRASSSIPLLMPPTRIDERVYVDGALGAGGGIPLPVAQRDGFSKFFVVLTRPRSYVKPPTRGAGLFRLVYPAHPAIAEGVRGRTHRYNTTRQELFDLERSGQACLVFPDLMNVENDTQDVAALRACFDAGLDQAGRELPGWLEFLGVRFD